jgi:threonylcarbamoyladenosine tRNA methylthiotransferase MtaB
LAFIRERKFAGLHPFRYSSRPGTEAEKRTDHLPEKKILARAQSLRSLDKELRTKLAAQAVGSVRRVVVEGRPGKPEGLCEDFLSVFLNQYPGPGFAQVRILSSKDLDAFAEVLR